MPKLDQQSLHQTEWCATLPSWPYGGGAQMQGRCVGVNEKLLLSDSEADNLFCSLCVKLTCCLMVAAKLSSSVMLMAA